MYGAMEVEQVETRAHGDSEVSLLKTHVNGDWEMAPKKPVGAKESSRKRDLHVGDRHKETNVVDNGEGSKRVLHVSDGYVVINVVDNESSSKVAGGVLNMRKWKRRARTALGTQPQLGVEQEKTSKRKLSKSMMVLEDVVRGKRGKNQGYLRHKMRLYWRRLLSSPAKPNDSPKLELSRAWEPLVCS